MVLLPMHDATGQVYRCLYVPQPVPFSKLSAPMAEADYLAADWNDPTAEVPLSFLYEKLGEKLLVAESWQTVFPKAGVLISSSISGGNLQTRFRQAAEAAPGRCWLALEQMSVSFPLPCPDGQGESVELPQEEGFYAESLGCRYIHSPDRAILFDTEETLEQKRNLAMNVGFSGWMNMQKHRR